MADYHVSKPHRMARVGHWDIETDVAVIGFGAAGACASLEAARSGASVVLFEAGAGSGGASALSGGEIYLGGGGGTPVQKAAGFEDSTEDLYQYLMMMGGPDADAAKVRRYADNSLAHYEWLVAQGIPYKGTYLPGKLVEPETDDTLILCGSEYAWPFNTRAKPVPRGHVIQFKGWGGGRLMMDIFEQRVREAGVDVRCSSRVLCLIADDDNTVHGLVVRIDGVERFVRARKGVILCAGGFVMNRDMVRRHAPLLLRSEDPIGATDDGSGILMGTSVGADTIHMDEYFCSVPWYPPESLVKGIFVNEQGQRFINEDGYHGRVMNMAFRQPGSKVYLLADNAIFGRPMEICRADVAAAGDTWAEVEQELGMGAGSLTATVDVYNRHAAEGCDPLFHKEAEWLKPLTEGPFAAIEFRAGYSFYAHFTLGGLNTLPSGEVLDRIGQPIAGLYAAGRTTCGLPRWGLGYSSGTSLADCTFFGRQAGASAAKRQA
ncbi:MAG: FAD-dependent oxidoreductase [Proteobacteria bacterium]|nr:FAD-dependent oxidoreductase [Pseudomonadota bacterium]HQR03556.1 FAD-dependent oxidoreductase [Rhodocyclaceae bacterium]